MSQLPRTVSTPELEAADRRGRARTADVAPVCTSGGG